MIPFIGAINGTDFINEPWNTTFKVFTDLLGMGFYLIPLSFLSVALYLKTHNPVMVSAFLSGSCILFASGSIFANYPEMALTYGIFAALGMVGAILGLFFPRSR